MALPSTSRLLNLPAELRNRIYRHVFKDTTFKIQRHNKNEYQTKAPGLLLSCHQIHDEAIGVYYSTAHFEGRDVEHIRNWALYTPAVKEYGSIISNICLDLSYMWGLCSFYFKSQAKTAWFAQRTVNVIRSQLPRLENGTWREDAVQVNVYVGSWCSCVDEYT